MTQKIKLLLVIPHLGGGGAEQVTAQLARYLSRDRFCVHLALFTPDLAGALPPPDWVTVHRFHRSRVRHGWLRILAVIRSIKPNVVLSSMVHLNCLILLLRPLLPMDTRILVRQNSSAVPSPIQHFACRLLYGKADAVICQSQPMADELGRGYRIACRKLAVLHNPVDVQGIRLASGAPVARQGSPNLAWPRLLCIGRLSHEKGYDLLLPAVARLRLSYPRIELTILGTGPEEQALRKLSHELLIGDSVHLPGYLSNPLNVDPSATLFVLCSRHEGMPNALLEAAAAGLPIVATPCCKGVQELLDGVPGAWLTAEISSRALADSILQALAALPRPPAPAMRFDHDFLAPFSLEASIAAYENLIASVVEQVRS